MTYERYKKRALETGVLYGFTLIDTTMFRTQYSIEYEFSVRNISHDGIGLFRFQDPNAQMSMPISRYLGSGSTYSTLQQNLGIWNVAASIYANIQG